MPINAKLAMQRQKNEKEATGNMMVLRMWWRLKGQGISADLQYF